MSIFLPWTYGETFLLPPDPKEWLPSNHEAYFVADLILKLTRRDILTTRSPEFGGRPAFHPVMLMTVIIFAYLRGVRSSRKIARLLVENVAFKILSSDQQPDFRTICRFRKDHSQWFERILVRTIHVGMTTGLIRFGAVVVDGTPLQASANAKHSHVLPTLKRMRKTHLLKLAEARAKAMLAEADAMDAAEDQALGNDVGSDSMLRGLTDERLERLDEAIAQAELADAERDRAIRKARRGVRKRVARERKGRPKPGGFGQPRRVLGRRKLSKKGSAKVLGRVGRVAIPAQAKVNVTDPDSRLLKAKNNGYMQGHQAIRATELHSGMILGNHVSPTGGESRELWPSLSGVLKVTGLPMLLRVIADAGYAGEPNLANPLRARVHELLICQKGVSKKAKSALIQAQRKLNSRKRYWMKRRGIAEGSNAGTKEARGMRRLLLRGRLGAAIELALDAIAHNIMKIRPVLNKLTYSKLNLALDQAAAIEF